MPITPIELIGYYFLETPMSHATPTHAHRFVHLDADAHLTDRQQALQAWLNQHIDGDYAIHSLLGDASFRQYHRIILADDAPKMMPKSMLVMDAPPDKESVSQFVQVANLLAPAVNVPDILAKDIPQGFLLLQDFGKTEFAHLLTASTDEKINSLYHQAMQSIIAIQSLDVNKVALPLYDAHLLKQEMALFSEWFLPYVGVDLSTDDKGQYCWQQLVSQIVTEVSEHPSVVVHRDYHSRNLMQDDVDGKNLAIIDFQDAVIGSYVYDLVSLLRDAYVNWPQSSIEAWTAEFWHMLQTAGYFLVSDKRNSTDLKQYHKDMMVMGVQRHLKVLGIFVRLAQRDGKTRYLADIPKVMDDLLFELNWLAGLHHHDGHANQHRGNQHSADKQHQQTQQVAQAFLSWLQDDVLPVYRQRFLS